VGKNKVSLNLNEIVMGNRKQLKQGKEIDYEPISLLYKFSTIQLTSDMLEDGYLMSKILEIEIREWYHEGKEQTKKSREIGSSRFRVKDILSSSQGPVQFSILDDKMKNKGAIQIANLSICEFYSFIDLHMSHGLHLVPIVAVDFSLANLTDDPNIC